MARVMIGPPGAAWLSENAGIVAAAPSEPTNVRRVMRFMTPSMACLPDAANRPSATGPLGPVDTVNYADTCGWIRAGADDSLCPT